MINSVYLYKCGRNLNRAYRTVEFFSVNNLCLVDCDAKLSGNLYKTPKISKKVRIINTGKIDGLTVEAALAITLYKIWESNKN